MSTASGYIGKTALPTGSAHGLLFQGRITGNAVRLDYAKDSHQSTITNHTQIKWTSLHLDFIHILYQRGVV